MVSIFFSSLTTGIPAQQSTNDALQPSLQIKTRTPEERIVFLLDIGQVYLNDNNFEAAINAYERVLELDPENEQARYIISHAYISAKQYEQAEVLLKQLIEENPENFQMLNNLAWLYATAENPRIRDGNKAIELAQKAMVLAPNDHHVWSTLSEAYYVSGDYEKAYRAITHMAQLAARYGKGLSEEAVEDYNEQIRKCKRALDTQKMLKESNGGEGDPAP